MPRVGILLQHGLGLEQLATPWLVLCHLRTIQCGDTVREVDRIVVLIRPLEVERHKVDGLHVHLLRPLEVEQLAIQHLDVGVFPRVTLDLGVPKNIRSRKAVHKVGRLVLLLLQPPRVVRIGVQQLQVDVLLAVLPEVGVVQVVLPDICSPVINHH